MDAVDPDKLRKHPRAAGTIGETANRIARTLLEQQQQETERRTNLELAKTDPEAFANRYVETEEQREARVEAESKTNDAKREFLGEFRNVVATWQNKILPPEQRAKISGKAYAGTAEQGFLSYLDDVTDAYRDSIRPVLRAELEAELRPLIEMEVRGQNNGAKRTPDQQGGTPTTGVLTQAEWNQNRRSPDWRKENRQRINAGLAAKTIVA